MKLHRCQAAACLALLLLAASCCGATTAAQQQQQKPTSPHQLATAAVEKWIKDNPELGCDWQTATFMIGLSTLARATGSASLRKRMESYGDRHGWSMCESVGHGGAANPDNQLVAATYAELALQSAAAKQAIDPTWLAATIKHLDAERADPGSIKSWAWVDTLFMAMSLWARAAVSPGVRAGADPYLDKMLADFNYAVSPSGYGFWSAEERLFHRDPPLYRVPTPKAGTAAVKATHWWSRGNGWAAAAMATALQYAPPGDPHAATYARYLKQHMARVAGLQGADGCWRSSLTRPEWYNVPETTGTALFTYAMATGVRLGVLDAGTFKPVVQRAWGCLTRVSAKVGADGSVTVGNCQPVGMDPEPNFAPGTTSSFCVGQFAMAAAAVAALG